MTYKYNSGITLLELMITVAVVALLASIAYPSYQNQIRRSKRTEAKVELMQQAQNLEKCYTMASTYVNCKAVPGASYTISSGTYKIEGKDKATATTFELVATPQGAQAKDSDCAKFTITQAAAISAYDSADKENASCLK